MTTETKKIYAFKRVKLRGSNGSLTTISIHPGVWKIWSRYADPKTILRLCREAAARIPKEEGRTQTLSAAIRDRVSEILRMGGAFKSLAA